MGYLGDNITTRQFCQYYTKMHDVELFNLKELPLHRWNFGYEFFEAMIIEDDTFLDKAAHVEKMKKSLQNNQNFIFISEKFQAKDLELKLASFGFSDFTDIDTDPCISIARKWFTF